MPSTDRLIYYENPVGYIWEHPDGYATVQYKAGERHLEHLKAYLTHVGRLLQQRGWNRILGDQRVMQDFTPEESTWIVEYWLDQNQQRPDKVYAAVLLAQEVFAQLPAEQLAADAQIAALTYRVFDKKADAEAWLNELAR